MSASSRSGRARASKIHEETARVVKATSSPQPTSPTLPVRRVTRGSLAKFAYNPSPASKSSESTPSLDIEDAIPSRKRKRVSPPPTIKPSPSPRKERKPARQTADPSTGEVQIHAPSNWREIYDTVKSMRLNPEHLAHNAAVDTMGCEQVGKTPNISPRDKRFHTLTSLMLSSQTKDTTNFAVMNRLRSELPAHKPGAPVGLNLENILAVSPEQLNELIWAVGFHNNKTKYIKAAALILRDKYNGDIPDSVEGLMSLPGVGPKMAYLCMSAAWGKDEGIGVDVHVHRITNIWGWNGNKPTKDPEQTRISLQKWLPRELWHEINWLLVGFGQTVCLPVGRKCGSCEVGAKGLCRGVDRAKVRGGVKVREALLVKNEEGEVVKKEEEVKEEEVDREVVVDAPKDEAVDIEGALPESTIKEEQVD